MAINGRADIRRVGIICLLALLLPGCMASSHILVGEKRAPIDPAQVKLYVSPPAHFEEIAIIDASSKNSFAVSDQGKTDVVIERLKAEAASLGANGVLIQATGSESTGGAVVGTTSGANPSFGTGIYASVMHMVGHALAIYVPE